MIKLLERRSKENKEDGLERCIIPSCKAITQYEKDTPIQKRAFFVPGVGQLCPNCYSDIYKGL